MTLRLIREPSINGRTLGVLFLDDRWFGWMCEDEIRERKGVPVAAWKVPGQTAIPHGRYRVTLTRSARFGIVLPELHDVPGFTGIRIHAGNGIEDTEGCLLPGYLRRLTGVAESRPCVAALIWAIQAAADRGDAAWIGIENPLSYGA